MLLPIAINFSGGLPYSVLFPSLPGCNSMGDSIENAIENAIEAATVHIEILLEDRTKYNKGYYIENLMLGKCDSDILNNKKIWDKLIKFIKYDEPALKDYIIEELSYEPNTIGKEN